MKERLGRKALWLEVVGETPVLRDSETLQEAFPLLEALAPDELYVQVFRSGKSWFRSMVADDAPAQSALTSGAGELPFDSLLAWAERRGIAVHAWMNMFNLGEEPSGVICDRLGVETLLYDGHGRAVTEYDGTGAFQLDAPGVWLDPAHPSVSEFLTSVVSEFAEHYPQVAGIHLDFFRYPYLLPIRPSGAVLCGADFGYGKETLARYIAEECGGESPFREDAVVGLVPDGYRASIQWDSWRRRQLGNYLKQFRSVIPEESELSVAVVAWPDRAYLTAYQDWRGWLSEQDVNGVHLMAYTADLEILRYLARQAVAFQSGSARVYAGLGAYLCKSEGEVSRQVEIALEEGCAGVNLFSFRNLKKAGLCTARVWGADG